MGIISPLIISLSGAGLVSVIVSFLQHRRSERALINRMRHQDQRDLLQALEITRRSLEGSRPDPEALANATALISMVAERLNESNKKDVLGQLAHGSERSKANYIAKLIDEIDVEHAS